MPAKISKGKFLKFSSKKLEDIQQTVSHPGSFLKRLFVHPHFFYLALFFILINASFIFLTKDLLPEKVPLFYSRPWGEDQLIKKDLLYLVPGFSLFFSLINFFLAERFWRRKNGFLAILLDFFSFLLSFTNTITNLKIIFLLV